MEKSLHNTKMIFKCDRIYPERMKNLGNMPEQLFVRGQLPGKEPSVAIIGARKCSTYGRSTAYELGRFAAMHGISVISGMASGIDSYAQQGALDAGGKTYAVLGCGTDICYPPSNRQIYEQIIQKGGVISEYPDGTPPYKGNFPMRNRIISALCDILIVVEGKRKSGSLITVDHALSQGKTVLAVPGRITDDIAEGCNKLIAQGAGILCQPSDMLYELGFVDGWEGVKAGDVEGEKVPDMDTVRKISGQKIYPDISDIALKVLKVLKTDPLTADEIAMEAGLSRSHCDTAILELMIKDLAREIMPGLYVSGR